jgi:EAL domain-containing protein (putative c-di-GMP-specific phosphodiesterase class I)
VVREAVRQDRAWQDQGLYLAIAVNIAAQSLQGGTALELVRTALEEFDVSPFSLEIELTESGVMGDPLVALEVLEQFDRLGVKVAIDDFGTGFSSLLYLRDLPVHTLKIDKSFVMDMLTSERNPAIVASTIALGHALGLRVVAEGVEDAETAAALLELGCDEGQGYFWTKALPPESFARWAADFGSQPVTRVAEGAVTPDVHALRAFRRLVAGRGAAGLTGVLVEYVQAVGGTVAEPDDEVVGLMQLDLTLGLAPAVLPVAAVGTMARHQLDVNLPLLLTTARLVLTARWTRCTAPTGW